MLDLWEKELRALWQRRDLLWQLIRRDLATQFKGSMLGALWPLLTPLLMLVVYTFVFSQIFGARWAQVAASPPSQLDFALNVFCGLIVFNIFAAVVARAPSLVVGHPNYVKKVVFPLALLPIMAVGSAVTQAAIAIVVLLVAVLLSTGELPWAVLLTPVILLPICLFTLGLAWLLSALGVFLRDLAQVTTVAVQALLFLSPVFYPVSAVPAIAKPFFDWNPLAWVIEALRSVTMYGTLPSLEEWSMFSAITGILAIACLGFFAKVKHAFADVL